MVTLNISVFLFLLFWSHSSPQMFHSQHQVEQSCSLIEQRILGILRAQILDVSIKEATSKVIKDILQTTVQHFQSPIKGVIATLERRIPESQETILQNLQSSIQEITAKIDSLEGKIETLERQIPERQETILQNLSSLIQNDYISTCKLLVSKLDPRPQLLVFEERCYFYGASQLNWTAAQEACQSAGGNLVTVSSLRVQKFLERFIPELSKWEDVWIGGTDIPNEGTFVWIGNGMNFNDGFQYWNDEEPNNMNGIEHCVEIRGSSRNMTKFWNDSICSIEQGFVCEI